MPEAELTIRPAPGPPPHISRLIATLRFVRRRTLAVVSGLSMEALDHQHDPFSNTLGMLLGHLVASELRLQRMSLDEQHLSPEDERAWGSGLALWARARHELKGFPLEHYKSAWAVIHERTLRLLADRTDAWLDHDARLFDPVMTNYVLWFHLIEDECSHRGQMIWLRQRLPGNTVLDYRKE
jgi:uncharacterized damage-inducible protein DinB